MIVIITNRHDEHADFVITELHKRKIPFLRINTEDFPQISSGELRVEKGFFSGSIASKVGSVDLSTICSVWYRRPITPVISEAITNQQFANFALSETQLFLRNLWYNIRGKWINDPDADKRAKEKGVSIRFALEAGMSVPDTLITNNPNSVYDFFHSHNNDIVVKPLGIAEAKDINDKMMSVYTTRIRKEDEHFLDSVIYAPTIFQEYIQKDFELRINVIGKEVFATAIYSQQTKRGKTDWRQALFHDQIQYSAFDLPEIVKSKCLEFMNLMDLRFGAIDMIVTPKGEYIFLEVNPAGQWAWIEFETGQPLLTAMVNLLTGY